MPTYAYRCTACEHAFEVQQSFTDDSLTVCPECAGRLRKVFSSVGVVFKGSGFYRNDARAGGSTGASSSTSSSTTTSSGSSSGGASSSTTSSSSASSGTASGSSTSGASTTTSAAPAASA